MAERCIDRADAIARAKLLLTTHDKPAVVEILPSFGATPEHLQYWAVSSSDDLDTVKGLLIGITVLSKDDR
jgi:hypothetical protein